MSTRSRQIAALAALVAALLLAGCGGDDSDSSGVSISGADEVDEFYDGIIQNGTQLGDSNVEAGVTIFIDLQSPESAEFVTEALPDVIDRHVRSGELQLNLRVVDQLGGDSGVAQRWAGASQLQNRVWQFSELFMRNQGEPDSGYVTDEFLEAVAEGAGVDVEQAQADLPTNAVDAAVLENEGRVKNLGIKTTPSFVLFEIGADKPRIIEVQPLTADAFSAALESALSAN